MSRDLKIGPHALRWTERGAGEPVVLLHSSGMSSRQWRKLGDELERTHRVIAVDLIGYGDAIVAPGERVAFALDQLGVERLVDAIAEPVHLVGHSYGGLLALLVALHRPRAVKSVAVYEPVAFGVLRSAGEHDAIATLKADDETVPWPDTARALEAWLEGFVDYWNGKGGWRGLSEPMRETFRRAAPKVVSEVRGLALDRTPHEAYATLEMPVLLLGGERTTVGERSVLDVLARSIPNVDAQTVAGAGHLGPITHAADVNAKIAAFLRR